MGAEDFKIKEEVSLPKAKPVLASRYLLKNLSADQVVKLVSGFKPGVASSGNVLASAFGPLADAFIEATRSFNEKNSSNSFSDHLRQLTEVWDRYCIEEISPHFDILIESEGVNIRDEILHYPLFARRRVLEIIRVKAPRLFYQLICVRPLSFYTVSQLWDPNADASSAVRDYYGILVRAYLSFYGEKVSANTYFDFVNVVRSPYRELYEISDDFEADYTYGKFRAIYLKQLAAARTGSALSLRPEQVEGQAHKSFYMPPPVTVHTISTLTLRWLSEQSYVFKNDLPATLLEFVLEQNSTIYKDLLADVGKTLTSGVLKGIEVNLDSEFPEFDQANLCFKELAKHHSPQVNLKLFESPLHSELLATSLTLMETEHQDKIRDSKRLELSISFLRGRRLYRPWEIKSLNQEIRGLQRDFYQLELELKSLEKKKSLLAEIATQVYEIYNQESMPELMQIADRLCASINLDSILKNEALKDPLLLAEVFSFENKKSRIDFIVSELESLGYIEAKLKNSADKELVDYLHIWREIHAGRKIKALKKEFTDYRVNRALVEYEHRVNKKSIEKIKELEPKLAAVASLVASRNNFDAVLAELAEIVINVSEDLAKEYFKLSRPKDKLEEFQNYSVAVSVIWDWITLQKINPYISGTSQAQKFQPWFEREFALLIKEKSKLCFEALSYLRPASALGLEPGADFNWKDLDVFQQHVTILVDKLLELAETFPQDQVLYVFTRYKAGLASPFPGFLNTQRYDLDSSTNKILLLNESQKHLFTSRYRRDALSAWVRFHEEAFYGNYPFDGLFFELIMKELKLKHKDWHLIVCLELLKLERSQVSNQREIAYAQKDESDAADELMNLIQISTDRLGFLEGLRRSLDG